MMPRSRGLAAPLALVLTSLTGLLFAACGGDGTGPGDEDGAPPRPLGTIVQAVEGPCQDPFGLLPAGSRCINLRIGCPWVAEAGVLLRESGSGARGTVVLTIGALGSGSYRQLPDADGAGYTNAMMDALLEDGYRLVEVIWNMPGVWEGPAGSASLACRAATAIGWVHDNVHETGIFAAQGNSGGSAQIAFSMAYYGLDEILDLANLSAGPPPCPRSINASLNGLQQHRCLPGRPDFEAMEAILSSNPRLRYSRTIVRFFVGADEPTPEIIATARALHDAIAAREKSYDVIPNTAHGVHRTADGTAALLASIRAAGGQ